MEIGNQIKFFRQRRGITQEAMANHFGITPQAISKWERGVATPDISMLPEISAYFGVSIDELFALSDQTRMERIKNMLWDVRNIPQADVNSARTFLLEKAKQEPGNPEPYSTLADLENHLATEHHDLAAAYAKEVLRIDPTSKAGFSALTEAMRGVCGDWNVMNHHDLIEYLKEMVGSDPSNKIACRWLVEQLIDAHRYQEAAVCCDRLEELNYFPVSYYRALIALDTGDANEAKHQIEILENQYSDNWLTWMSIGDFYARKGEYEVAETAYRKYLALQEPPRYTDGFTAIAQMREAMGNYGGAISAIREEISALATDWDTTEGETVDYFLRKITRLEKKMHE